MKYLFILLMLVSINVNAQCYVQNGMTVCPTQDYRTDYNSPKIYTPDGQYRGNLNNNQYDPNSISNPYGRYGSPYSNESINNPYANPNGNYYWK
jgi:hypothetical protein